MAASMRRDSPWLALVLLTAISTVGFIDRIVMNVLAVPIQTEFELSDTQVGLLTGLAFAVLNVALGIVVARYAERGNRMSLIAVGTLLWSIATAACGLVTSWVQLLLARIGVGVGEAVGLPATQSVISDYFPPERRASASSRPGIVAMKNAWRQPNSCPIHDPPAEPRNAPIGGASRNTPSAVARRSGGK